jgi:hypothetical protein
MPRVICIELANVNHWLKIRRLKIGVDADVDFPVTPAVTTKRCHHHVTDAPSPLLAVMSDGAVTDVIAYH